ncbi:LAME_0H03136g1_1 [Lachancea meyersii CBS 8951]|uniref:LAME_0H03136g1_1 n=1 Tax=Lachancea meyersii CBS 8951 TaxID=1266667 RepID=A0A1G4KDK6_9SACH|nr:LAME_0H03136g1_1 [Lachancea meyersii CBS 8951]
MGLKKFFKMKPPEEDTAEMNREKLIELGIPTKNVNRTKKEKFAAYGHFAKDKAEDRFYAPPGYENHAKKQDDSALEDLNKSEMDSGAETGAYLRAPNKSSFDPYARNNVQNHGQNSSPYTQASPYESTPSNPYERVPGNPYGQQQSSSNSTKQQNAYSSPYGGQQSSSSPYGSQNSSSNPYGGQQSSTNPYRGQQPYASQSFSRSATPATSQNPYSGLSNDPYSSTSRNNSYNALSKLQPMPASGYKPYTGYDNNGNSNRSAAKPASDPYSPRESIARQRLRTADDSQEPASVGPEDSFDFEGPSKAERIDSNLQDDDIDLNATMQEEEDDFNKPMQDGYQGNAYQRQQLQQQPSRQGSYRQDGSNSRGFQTFEEMQRENEQRQQQEEDEAVDEIKQEIRFTKQSSVASTRNTLKMAQEAEMAGTNTLGMLGHQSEKLNNVERNLDLMKMQNRVADDKVAELKKLNRNILAVHVSNPFNSKRRLREAEDRIRTQRIEDKLIQKQTNGRLLQSTNRIESAINSTSQEPHDSVKQRYQNQAILEKSKRYQFENDEEDDEMELEIDKNLDKIGQISGRLKRLAVASGEEIDAQQNRVANIEEDTDNLDIRIHLNTTRLTQIR